MCENTDANDKAEGIVESAVTILQKNDPVPTPPASKLTTAPDVTKEAAQTCQKLYLLLRIIKEQNIENIIIVCKHVRLSPLTSKRNVPDSLN